MRVVKAIQRLTIPALVALAGCAAPAPYQPFGESGAGYFSDALSPAKFSVAFSGNSGSGSTRVSDYALLRAAEVTLENKFSYFVVLRRALSSLPNVTPADMELAMIGPPGSHKVPGGTGDLTMDLVIHCYSQPPPPKQQIQIYDAQQIAAQIRKKYALSGE